MGVAKYFTNTELEGTGILATSDAEGNVDLAVYSKPYVIDEQTIGFSMLERLSFSNIQSNPKAAFMFIEDGPGHEGKRLYLTAAGEEKDQDRIAEIKSHKQTRHKPMTDQPRHFVYFKVDRVRPLVGDND